MLQKIFNVLIEFGNAGIRALGAILSFLAGLFPNSPFGETTGKPSSFDLGYVTWLIDFPTIIIHLTSLAGAILIYYGIRVLARWVKIARG